MIGTGPVSGSTRAAAFARACSTKSCSPVSTIVDGSIWAALAVDVGETRVVVGADHDGRGDAEDLGQIGPDGIVRPGLVGLLHEIDHRLVPEGVVDVLPRKIAHPRVDHGMDERDRFLERDAVLAARGDDGERGDGSRAQQQQGDDGEGGPAGEDRLQIHVFGTGFEEASTARAGIGRRSP